MAQKAIVVRYSGLRGDSNYSARPDLIRRAGERINREIATLDDQQNQMRKVGTSYLVEIMDHYDIILPVHNFRYGSHPDVYKIQSTVWKDLFTRDLPDGCWLGCMLACSHGVDHFHLRTGPYACQGVLVDGPEYKTVAGLGANLGIFEPRDKNGIPTLETLQRLRIDLPEVIQVVQRAKQAGR